MGSILAKEKINTDRQYNLDLLKALAIAAMIICHAVTILSEARTDYTGEFGFWAADTLLGSYLAVAHAFMFCMGAGFIFSRDSSPRYLFVRGIKIYLMAYVLNFFRGGIYSFVAGFFDSAYWDYLYYTLFVQDILQFAGLAMMLTAFFKKIKLDCWIVLLLSVLMSVFSQFAALKFQGNAFTNILVGSFVPTVENASTFVLCGWYVFVASGICFGKVLQRVADLDRFYRRLLCVSSVIMIVYIAASIRNGCFFLSPDHNYYYAGILEAIGLMSIDFVLMALMYFGLKRLPKERMTRSRFLGICWKMSRNINQIYWAQWCIIGLLAAFLVYLWELPLPYWITYSIGVITIPLSYLAADKWVRARKKKRKQ